MAPDFNMSQELFDHMHDEGEEDIESHGVKTYKP
jgi:hypothetical protein